MGLSHVRPFHTRCAAVIKGTNSDRATSVYYLFTLRGSDTKAGLES
jgi:hypothetical protein